MSARRVLCLPVAVLTALGVSLAACASPEASPTAPAGARPPAFHLENYPGDGVAGRELLELCLAYPSGTGPAVVVDVSTRWLDPASPLYGTTTPLPSLPLAAGQCVEYYTSGGPYGEMLTATEHVPFGYSASSQREWMVFDFATRDSVWGADAVVPGPTNSGLVHRSVGTLLRFTNTPWPANGSGEGCTPGFWKQPQHLASWPLATGTLVNTLFGVTYVPSLGKNAPPYDGTLLAALQVGGGGANALMRHAVAALLNAMPTSGVSYPYAVVDVLAMVRGALADPALLGPTTAALEAANERGCPLH